MPGLGGLALMLATGSLLFPRPGRAQSGSPPESAPSVPDLAATPQPWTPDAAAPGIDPALVEAQIRQNEQLATNARQVLTFGGYVDLGFFAPQGNGAGYVQDYGHATFPEYGGYGWVFLGDILAPAVNARGEVADLGDAPGVNRFDSIHSRGSPGFIVNEVNLRLVARPVSTAIITASINFTPRTGSNFSLGDVFDVDLAQVEWLPTESQRTSLFVGKMESVLGIEYRDRKSDRRFGITPSLIARYTTGTAIGVKARSKLGPDDAFVVAAALTNGSNTIEAFHFYDETDSNAGKTASGRVSARLPISSGGDGDAAGAFPFNVELGFSGSYGAQDRTTSNAHPMWFFGPDLLAEVGAVDLKAEWLKGAAAGDPTQDVYQLQLHGGGFLEADVMLTAFWGLLGRIEYRDAFVALGMERAYVTKSWRGTIGGRCLLSHWAALRAEYLHNGEYGRIPQVRNDVFTSSLVLSY
jgi:hypothetical protein